MASASGPEPRGFLRQVMNQVLAHLQVLARHKKNFFLHAHTASHPTQDIIFFQDRHMIFFRCFFSIFLYYFFKFFSSIFFKFFKFFLIFFDFFPIIFSKKIFFSEKIFFFDHCSIGGGRGCPALLRGGGDRGDDAGESKTQHPHA